MTATPTKPEELDLLEAVLGGECPRTACDRLGVNYKRAERWTEKWQDRWGYDWGVHALAGFFYDDDKPAVRAFIDSAREANK